MNGTPPHAAASSSRSCPNSRASPSNSIDVVTGVEEGDDGKGSEIGRLGFEVADVGRGGRERTVWVRPGMRRTTTFWIEWGLSTRIQEHGGASAIM